MASPHMAIILLAAGREGLRYQGAVAKKLFRSCSVAKRRRGVRRIRRIASRECPTSAASRLRQENGNGNRSAQLFFGTKCRGRHLRRHTHEDILCTSAPDT